MMRTVPYRTVLHEALDLLGVVPAEAAVEQAQSVTRAVNRRLRAAWEAFDWPELVRTEERYFRAEYDAAATYASGDEVWWTDGAGDTAYYRATGATTGNDPDDEDFWELPGDDFERWIGWEQAGETAIGEALDIYAANPATSRTPREIPYLVTWRGLEIVPGTATPASVWVRYRLRPVEMTATEYDATEAYAAGEAVYFTDDGRVYEAVEEVSALASPSVDPGSWLERRFPYILAHAVALGAYADVLRVEGQSERAAIEERAASGALMAEVEKIEAQQHQARRWGVQTRR